MAQRSKREAILQVAGDLFVAHGFSKVSIDQIAAAVPISKPTLYAHFKDKRALYGAVIESRCRRNLSELTAMVEETRPVEEALFAVGYQFLTMVLGTSAMQMHRTLTAEVAEFPEIGRLFYHSGPEQLHRFLADYLARMHTARVLNVADPALSADMFLGMMKGNMHLQCLLAVRKPPTKAQMRARVAYALSLFLAAHRVG
ncbi:MAG: TetR/AcrR family transcriptional regulator [Pseudomonadota bacterium]